MEVTGQLMHHYSSLPCRRNGEATKERFKNRSDFYVPEIYWDLSSKKILTMEFIDGVKVNDLEGLKKLGVSPKWVRTTLLEVFAEMMYQHGVVHCDPHVSSSWRPSSCSLEDEFFVH